jgi:hypothetical protein
MAANDGRHGTRLESVCLGWITVKDLNMPEKEDEKSKIIIDDDWKAQAQAEKEKLAHEAEEPAKAAGQGAAAGGEEEHALPPANFTTLVNSFVTQIVFALGGIVDPQTGKRYLDLALAKHHIDMLSVLEEKTKGNLSEDEKKLLDHALYETRMQYVQIAQRVAQM